MNLETPLLLILAAFILIKIRDIVKRNKLDVNREQRLLTSAILTILFLITNYTLPYPESLYWFLGLGIVAVTTIMSFDVIKVEFKRFIQSNTKDRAINILFYSLLIITINLFS